LTSRYFDSSALLSQMLVQQGALAVQELWQSADQRLSSSLLRIECVIAVRRAALFQGGFADDEWAQERLDLLSEVLDGLNFKTVDASIEEIIQRTPALADCRTLDAIHVATALHFRTYVEGSLEIVTLDGKMRQLAGTLGFQVRPSG
jgi:predicted nucleic acid-binding protein